MEWLGLGQTNSVQTEPYSSHSHSHPVHHLVRLLQARSSSRGEACLEIKVKHTHPSTSRYISAIVLYLLRGMNKEKKRPSVLHGLRSDCSAKTLYKEISRNQ